MTYLVVDGHSILHAWPDLAQMNRNPKQRIAAREKLLQRLRHYQDMRGEQVVVVFDGTQSKLNEERQLGGLQIFYADKGSTADKIIERLVTKYAAQHRMQAATADGMIRDVVDAAGGVWMSPQMLLHLVVESESQMRDLM
jgi:uncharacterized protein